MKFLFDLFPVILFFVAFKLADIYVATSVAIAATFAQVGWLKLRGRKVDTMLWASLAIIVVFGGATLALHDESNESHAGDLVLIEECRPISKTKAWRMAKLIERSPSA
jgi:hypothetical protein